MSLPQCMPLLKAAVDAKKKSDQMEDKRTHLSQDVLNNTDNEGKYSVIFHIILKINTLASKGLK